MKSKIGIYLFGFISSILLFLIIFFSLGKDRIKKYYQFLYFNLRESLSSESNFQGSDFKSCLPEIISYIFNGNEILEMIKYDTLS